MSRDAAVYARESAVISADAIRARMSAQGLQVQWHGVAPPGATAENWERGYFLAAGETDPRARVDVTVEALKDYLRQDAASGVGDERYRAAILAARTLYRFSVTWSADTERERVLVNLIDVVAELGDGLVLDMLADRFYDLREYRAEHLGPLPEESAEGGQ